MEIEMKIRGLMMDPAANTPIIILKDVNGESMLPIWVGPFEANAIAVEIEKLATQRPMTHDLLKNIIWEFGASVRRVVITDLIDNTFLAVIERSEEHTSELQSLAYLVCRLLLEKKNKQHERNSLSAFI